jgi:hypothetical protein
MPFPVRSNALAAAAGVLALGLTSACASAPRRTGTLGPAKRVEHLDAFAREPMVVEHPDGTLFVAGYGRPRPTLWRSANRGATWSRVEVGGEAEGAVGNSDVDLAVAPDGTLYFASMLFDREKSEGRQIAMGVSADGGATWRWTTLSRNRFDDRPWVEVAPDGTAHAIWNDGSGVAHTVSRDRGISWSPPQKIHPKGGSSHLAVGPAGEVAVRITPASASGNRFDAGVDLIAVSTDAGQTWRKIEAPGERDWSPDMEAPAVTPRWVEPVAWDAAGRLYSLWTDRQGGVHVARSRDRGDTWTEWKVASFPGLSFFPYLVARGKGELAATWLSATSTDLAGLEWRVARIEVGDGGGRPRVLQSPPQSIESRRFTDVAGGEVHNDAAGEYLPVAWLRDGAIGVVTPIQNLPANRLGFAWWRFDR